MLRAKKRTAAVLAILAVGFAVPDRAEARRFYRPVVRRGPVVVAPVVRRRPVVVAAPRVGVGYGRVRVAAPGVGVFVGC